MRGLKFRAWDKIQKAMASVTAITFDSPEYNPSVDLNYRLYIGFDDTQAIAESVDLSEVELMQFTGLKDKKGVEIYDSDIVEFAYNGLFLKGEVVFGNGGWELKGVDYGEHFRLIEIVHLCEVIGNIYQHKGLMDGYNS